MPSVHAFSIGVEGAAKCNKVVTGGAVLGPHTATGSGKITVWHMPGLYSVSLDAADTSSSTGLTTTNATLTVGDALYATSAGLLTPDSGSSFEADVVVGRFVEFALFRRNPFQECLRGGGRGVERDART